MEQNEKQNVRLGFESDHVFDNKDEVVERHEADDSDEVGIN